MRLSILPLRMALGLGFIMLVQSGMACWIVAAAPGTWLSVSGVVPAAAFPQLLCGLSLGLAVLTAPLFFMVKAEPETELAPNASTDIDSRPKNGSTRSFSERFKWGAVFQRSGRAYPIVPILGRAAFSGLLQGLMLAYLLLVAARISPLEPSGVVEAAIWLGLFTVCSILLCHLVPKGFSGFMFIWAVGIPIFAYFVAEVFLSTPEGSAGWVKNHGPHAPAIREGVHWILSLSPGTGVIGVLTGVLPDGSEFAGAVPWLFMCTFTGMLAVLLWRIPHPAAR